MSVDLDANTLLAEVNSQPINEKGFVPDEYRTALFRKLRSRQENRTCFDCPARNPTWISLNNGVYVCLVCSGEHRRMGVHISFVRSVELDSFSKDQLAMMILGGNGKARSFYKSLGIEGKRKDSGGAKAVDYYDKASVKLRSELERNTLAACQKHDIQLVNIKAGTASPGSPVKAPNSAPATSGIRPNLTPRQGQDNTNNNAMSFNQATGMWEHVTPDTSNGIVTEKEARTSDTLINEMFGNFNNNSKNTNSQSQTGASGMSNGPSSVQQQQGGMLKGGGGFGAVANGSGFGNSTSTNAGGPGFGAVSSQGQGFGGGGNGGFGQGSFGNNTTVAASTSKPSNTPKSGGSGSGGGVAFFPKVQEPVKAGETTHFAASAGPKKAVAGKAKELDDDDLDFDFGDFEKELTRVVPVELPKTVNGKNNNSSTAPGLQGSFSHQSTPVIEGSYGMPTTNSPSKGSQDMVQNNNFGGGGVGNVSGGFGNSGGGFGNSGGGFGNQPQQQPPQQKQPDLSAFNNKKGFGSSDFFNDQTAHSGQSATANPNFCGQTAFGSDAFFGRDNNGSGDRRDSKSDAAKIAASIAMDKASEIGEKAWEKFGQWKQAYMDRG